jgi:hypothetical protein
MQGKVGFRAEMTPTHIAQRRCAGTSAMKDPIAPSLAQFEQERPSRLAAGSPRKRRHRSQARRTVPAL